MGADNDSYLDNVFARPNLNSMGCAQISVSVLNADNSPSFLFPNPNRGQFKVFDRDDIAILVITDLMGREILSEARKVDEVCSLALPLGTGIYLLRVHNLKGNAALHRLVVAE